MPNHTYLACPLHALPDGEVDQQPGQGQRAGQGPADGAGLPQARRHLVHVPPRSRRGCVKGRPSPWGQRGGRSQRGLEREGPGVGVLKSLQTPRRT